MLGIEHVLRVNGRAFVQRPARPKITRTQVLSMGAVHPIVSSVPLLHTASRMARTLDQVGHEHSQSGGSGALLPVVREVPRPRQDHALHDQVGRSVLVHAAASKGRHKQKMRLRHTTVVFYRRLMLLLFGSE